MHITFMENSSLSKISLFHLQRIVDYIIIKILIAIIMDFKRKIVGCWRGLQWLECSTTHRSYLYKQWIGSECVCDLI